MIKKILTLLVVLLMILSTAAVADSDDDEHEDDSEHDDEQDDEHDEDDEQDDEHDEDDSEHDDDDEHDEDDEHEYYEDGAKIKIIADSDVTADEAREIALDEVDGTVKEIEQEYEHGMLTWEVKIKTATGEAEVMIDADTGDVLRVKIEGISDDDYDGVEIENIIDSNTAISADEAMEIALDEIPGTVKEIEQELEHGRLVWEIKIITDEGTEAKVKVDVDTGEIVDSETEFLQTTVDETELEIILEENTTIDIKEAVTIAKDVVGGTTKEIRQEIEDNGMLVWEIKLNQEDGRVAEVKINSETGEVISIIYKDPEVDLSTDFEQTNETEELKKEIEELKEEVSVIRSLINTIFSFFGISN